MIFKTLLSLASAAFLAATATASSHDALPVQTFDSSEQLSRDLQLTGDTDFLITPTTVSTTDSTLTLSYTNGAGDGESPPGGRFDIFTLTSSGPITGTGLTNVDADPTLSCFSKGGSNFVYAPSTSGITGVSTIAASASTFAISFNENATATQPYYSATGPSTALIVKYFLCVKFTLTKDIGSGPAVETDINYRETALEVTLTLNGTIANATAFTVDTLDPGTDTDEVIEYTVSAGLCPSFTTTVTQGLTVPICIVSDQFPLASIDSIDELTFTATVPDPDVVQAIITGGSAADGATGLYGIATADAECPANECIHVDVIVYAIFANEATTNLIVEISGDAVMSVGRTARKLRAKVQPTRELQETLQIQAFRNEIVLPPLPGSGATLANVCAAAVPFAVAVVAGALTL
mmetsp:Transcript_40307/g.96668  ORF Transcript_40307/g.96668 Transcript_40307/m.96668 type:complete len:408 (+) Transcript_40307:88-1311(+)